MNLGAGVMLMAPLIQEKEKQGYLCHVQEFLGKEREVMTAINLLCY